MQVETTQKPWFGCGAFEADAFEHVSVKVPKNHEYRPIFVSYFSCLVVVLLFHLGKVSKFKSLFCSGAYILKTFHLLNPSLNSLARDGILRSWK